MKTTPMTDALYQYVIDHTDLPHPILDRVAHETEQHPRAQMQISRDQGMLMHMLVKLTQAKRCLEIGCFTGYSAISVASALPEGGVLMSLDNDPEIAEVARRYFAEAGLSDKIELRLGDARQSLEAMPGEDSNSYDLAFIDADKESYAVYYEHCLRLVRSGGLIIVDNVIWNGAILDTSDVSDATKSVRSFNENIMHDDRVQRLFLHIADGLFFLLKK